MALIGVKTDPKKRNCLEKSAKDKRIDFSVIFFQVFIQHTDLLTALGMLMMGVPYFLVPWMSSLSWLGLCFFVIGIGKAWLNTGTK